MLIPIHAIETLPGAQIAELLAYSDQTTAMASLRPAPLVASICDSGQCARLGTSSESQMPRVPVSEILSAPSQPELPQPLFTQPAADGSDLGLRIKRGICSAMVAIPFSLYLYFSLGAPRSRRARKHAGTFASTTIRNVVHDL